MIETGRFSPKETKPSEKSSNYPAGEEPQLIDLNIYHGLFLHMNEGFAYCKVIFDDLNKPVDYVFSDVNGAYRRLTGLYNKRVLGRKASEVFKNLDDEVLSSIKKCGPVASTGRSLMFERHCHVLDRWFNVNAYCPKKGYFAMIIKDITARKKTEQALRQSEKQYKKLANSITDPFFALDSSLKLNYWNRASEKFTGVNAENALGKHFFDVFGKSKATKKAVKAYTTVMKTNNPRTFIDNLPNVPSNIIFEIQIYPTGNGISVFAKDVTERKKLQGSLEQYTKRLEELVKIRTEKLKSVERLAAIGETAGMIGHDIRNPLQSIVSELYLAKDDLNDLPESETKKNLLESILSIEEQTMYISKIVTDLQDYAKTLTPSFQEIDLEETIQAVISELDIPENIAVSCVVEKPFPNFKTDPSFMRRILTNLVRNGVQAMQDKGGKLTVSAFPRQQAIIMAVSDTGTGIPEEAKDKIFKPLFTTKSKGQGFGLAVVKKLVDALGGCISFETKVGRGTSFIIELPLNKAA
jgi:PAS domain S-box-containing protein